MFGNICEQLVHGYMLETQYSLKKVASIYLAGVVFGEITVGALDPWNYGYGASGGCFALIAVNWMVTIGNPKKVNFSVFRYGFVLLEAILMLLVPTPAGPNAAHLGGGIGGLLIGATLILPVIPKRYKKNFSWLCRRLLKLIFFTGIVATVANIVWYGESRIRDTNKATVAHVIKENSKSIKEVLVDVIVKQVLSTLNAFVKRLLSEETVGRAIEAFSRYLDDRVL